MCAEGQSAQTKSLLASTNAHGPELDFLIIGASRGIASGLERFIRHGKARSAAVQSLSLEKENALPPRNSDDI